MTTLTIPQVFALLMPAVAAVFCWVMWLFVRRQKPSQVGRDKGRSPTDQR